MSAAIDLLGQLSPGALGRSLSETELALFSKYLEILLKWQKSQRLIGYDDPDRIARDLFAGSLVFDRFIPGHVLRLLDLGSGAGLPGIPLKIVRPALEVVLLESRAKRVSFLRAATRELALPQLRAVGERAETASDLHGRFDAVTARCVGPLEAVTGLARQFLRPGGVVVVSGPPDSSAPEGIPWITVDISGVGRRHMGTFRYP